MSATRILFWLWLTYVLWGPCPEALALNPALDVSQYGHSAWRSRESFTTGHILSLAQAADGYLWFGTELGLVRFDGVRTSPWQPPAGGSLPDNNISSFLATRDGTLWVGTVRGLMSLNRGRLIAHPEFEGAWVISLLEDRGGTVWVGAGSPPSYTHGLLCAIRSSRPECYGNNGQFPGIVSGLWKDRRGSLWVATPNEVWRWKPDPPKLYALPGTQALGETATGAIVVLSQDTVRLIIDGEVKEFPLPQLPRPFRPTRVLCDHDGGLWIGSRAAGLLHVHEGRTDWFARQDGLSGDNVSYLLEDREGNIWVATEGGLDRFHALATTTYSARQGVIGGMGSVLADLDGGLWFTTTEGLYKWHEGRIARYRGEHQQRSQLGSAAEPVLDGVFVAGLPEDPAGSLYRDRHGRLWVGSVSELGYLDNNRFISLRGVPPGYIDSFAEDNEGNLWIAHREAGLLRLPSNLKVQEQFPWKKFGGSGVAVRLAADPMRDGLWLGQRSGGIAYFKNGQVRASYGVREGLGKGPVNHLRVAADGTVWVATDGGLSRVKAGRITTLGRKSGLPCDAIDWSIDDGKGSVWLYTHCGLVRVASSDLEGWAAATQEGKVPNEKLRAMVLGDGDGIPGFAFGSTYGPHLASTVDGKLWLATREGVTVVDPDHLASNKLPPPVHVEQITADRTTYDPTGRLALPPLVRDLQIEYTALSLVAPEKMQFRYRLEGHDHDWQTVGNRRQAFYTDLPPGDYRFRVIASNNSGVWNEKGASLDFSIAPAYWQTTWFRALPVAAILAFLWMLYWLRMRQLAHVFETRVEAQVEERTRLARELHDTLLQSFNGLLLRFRTVQALFSKSPDEARKILDGAIDQTREALIEGRQAVQGLRSSAIGSQEFADAIKTLTEELAADPTHPAPAEVRLKVEGTPRPLRPLIRDEMYRIASEALRNALRHAGASRIEIQLGYDEGSFELRVRDDGKGIDPKFLADESLPGHFGLRGMRERVERMGAALKIWSAPASGTELALSVPAATAYGTERSAARSWLPWKIYRGGGQKP